MPEEVKDHPIICLCGSTRFKEEYEKLEKELAFKGYVVLTVSCFVHSDFDPRIKKHKELLDDIHLQKIRMSSSVLVINKYAYLGESTRKEIEYAKGLRKEIRYLEGWGFPLNARKAHYFTDGRSLCRGWIYFGSDLEHGNDSSPDNCTTCMKRLEKRKKKGML